MKNLYRTSVNAWQAINTRVPDYVMFSSSHVQVFEIMKIKDEISFELIILQTPICLRASVPPVSSFLLQTTRIVRYFEPKSQRIEDERRN